MSTGGVWSKFYRRAFLQKWNILFERVEWEDSLFDFEVFVRHPWTKSVGCEVYCYEHGDVSSIVSTMEKKRVLMQMKDLYYIREKMHRYREGSEGKELLSVSWIVLTGIVFVIARKIMHIPLTYREWRHCTQELSPEEKAMVNAKYETLLKSRLIVKMESLSLRYYWAQCLACLLFRYILKGRLLQS